MTDEELLDWALDETGCSPECATRADERVLMAHVIARVRQDERRRLGVE